MKRIIYIASRRLLPLNSGDKILTFNIIKKLAKDNKLHIVNLNDELSYSPKEIDEIEKFCVSFSEIKFVNKHSIIKQLKSVLLNKLYWKIKLLAPHVKNEFSKIFNEHIEQYKQDNPIIIWDHLRSTLFYSENECENILIEHNNESDVIKKRSKNTNNILLKYLIENQAKMMREYINNIHNQMHKVIILNKNDFQDNIGSNKYIVMKHLLIEFSHDKYLVRNKSNSLKLLFIGSLDWYPNVEAIKWFLENVKPKLDELELKYEFSIVGRNPNTNFINYIKKFKSVNLFQNVPSIEIFYLQSDIFICPINTGSGINIKLFEALSYGIPIVLTSFAKRGYFGLNFLMDSDDSNSFVNEILKLRSIQYRNNMSVLELDYYNEYCKQSSKELNELFFSN